MIKLLLTSGVFWTLLIGSIISAVIIFIFPYFFDSYKDWTYRLLIAFSFFFIVVIAVLLYIVFLQEKTQEKIKEYKEKREKSKEKDEILISKINDIKNKFYEALKILKVSTFYKNKRSARYELPWYLLVGKEQEGKTTLLEASGLDFPLNVNYEERSVKEEGTSKEFLWYYAEHAIFIDMPGKYIDKELNEIDQAVWEKGFLKLFAKKRLRRPLNGIVLNISVETFITKSEKDLNKYAKDLRDRFDELSKGFVSSIPIYLIITKSDKIVGYNEYFSSLTEEEKEEVLGVTFDNPMQNIDTSIVKPELEKLLKQINSSVIDKLHYEWDEDTRNKIFLFPDEFSSIFEKIEMFTDICFAQTRYRKALMLRGVYFTSVPEEEETKSSYLLSNKNDNKLSVGRSSRGYFIKKLLKDFIFSESDLIKMDDNFKKVNKRRQSIALFSAVTSVLLLSSLWIFDFVSHNKSLRMLEERIEKVVLQKSQIKSSDNFEKTLLVLNEIESIKDTYESEISSHFYRLNFYDVEPQTIQLYNLYENVLSDILLPRVAKNLKTQMLSNLNNYQQTWTNTEIYLMLNKEVHRKDDYLKTVMGVNWAKLYPNKPLVQKALNHHFQNLLSLGFDPYKMDEKALKTARSILYNKPNVVIVYDELKRVIKEETNLESFSYERLLGANVGVFNGDTYKIPGLYTKKGFKNIIEKKGQKYVSSILKTHWVLGARIDLTKSELDEIYSQVLSLYFKDYKRYWLTATTKLNIPKLLNKGGLQNQLEVLSLVNSPIISILQGLKENTKIFTLEEMILKNPKKGNKKLNKLAKISAKNKIKGSKLVANIKTLRLFFKPYHNLINEDGMPNSSLENAMLSLNKVFAQMNSLFASLNISEDSFILVNKRINGQIEPIIQQFTSLPLNVSIWFEQVLDHNWNYLIVESKQHIKNKYEEEVFIFYQEKIANKYPFNKSENDEFVSLDDFNTFFKTEGILDDFVKKYIVPFSIINKRTYKTYKTKIIDSKDIGLDMLFMRNILAGLRIKNMFYGDNNEKLKTNFHLTPSRLERTLSTMEFSNGDTSMIYEHDVIRDIELTWPIDNTKDKKASFKLYDIKSNKIVDISSAGNWALFKVLDKLNVKSVSEDSIDVYYETEDEFASLNLKGNISNLFDKDKLFDSFKLAGDI